MLLIVLIMYFQLKCVFLINKAKQGYALDFCVFTGVNVSKYELYFSYSLALALFLTRVDLLLMASEEGSQCASDSVQL